MKPKQQEAAPALSEAAVVFLGARRGAAGRRGPLFRLAGPASVTLNPGSQAGEYEYIYICFFFPARMCSPGAPTRRRHAITEESIVCLEDAANERRLTYSCGTFKSSFLEQQPGGATHRHTQTHAEKNKSRPTPQIGTF